MRSSHAIMNPNIYVDNHSFNNLSIDITYNLSIYKKSNLNKSLSIIWVHGISNTNNNDNLDHFSL